MADKIFGNAFSFKGFSVKRMILGLRKPAIAAIGAILIGFSESHPVWHWVGGISAAAVWGIVEFYCRDM